MHPDPLDRLIQAAEMPIDPRTDFADTLLQDLLAQIESGHSEREKEETSMTNAIATSPGIGSISSRPITQKRANRSVKRMRSFLPSHLATAALLLLTIIGGLYAVGTPGHFGVLHQSQPGVTNELIASVDVDEMPDKDAPNGTFIGISRFMLEPGESMESGPASYFGDGVFLFEVEAGTLSLTSNGTTKFLTGGSDQGAPLSEKAEATLQTGDRGVTLPGGSTTWRNDGQVATRVLIAQIALATNTAIELDQVDLVNSFTMKWPDPPATFTFRRLTFQPGARLPVEDLPGIMMIAVEAGEIDVPISYANGSTGERSFGPLEGFTTTNWDLAMDGNLHNSGSEPVVIYVLSGESKVPAATPTT